MSKIDISGTWRYRLDPENVGTQQQWFTQQFEEKIMILPGTTNSNQIGTKQEVSLQQEFSKESLTCFRENYHYQGVLWLQKTVTLPKEFRGKELTLFLERILGQSALWMDGQYIGEEYSLSIPHRYRFMTATLIQQETITLTLRLDNRDLMNIGERASGYSLDTQGFWCGIVGDMSLTDSVCTPADMTLTFVEENELLRIELRNERVSQVSRILISDTGGESVPFELEKEEHHTDKLILWLRLKSILSWQAKQPNYYDVTLVINDNALTKRWGFLSLSATQGQLVANGKKLYLKGNLDCGVFPYTGYPVIEEAYWEKVFQKQLEYGFNHVRFHSWCPPDIAFQVADRLGIYLMVEGPFWLDEWFHNSVGDYQEHYGFISQECFRIVREYGHHPSFCFFAVGNELHGDFPFLATILRNEVFQHQQILTTLTANTTNLKREFYDGADDFFIGVEYKGHGLRGNRFLDEIVTRTDFCYDNQTAFVPVPTITHEIGQYASYPSLDEIRKFSKEIEPTNLLAIKNELQRKQLLEKHNTYTYFSGLLARDCYKAEIEAVVRSNQLSGFQLLGLQDYPGQNTAMIGMLDSHWEEKGFCTPEDFCEFNQGLIPMVELSKRIFGNKELMDYHIGIRNSTGCDILPEDAAKITVTLGEQLLESFSLEFVLKSGEYQIIKKGSFELGRLACEYGQQFKLQITVQKEGQRSQNHWPIWVFATENLTSDDIIQDSWLSPKIINGLQTGQTCVVSLSPSKHAGISPGNYFPVFWSPVFFESTDACGMMVNKEHSLFRYFPTENYLTLQWKRLVENSVCFPAHTSRAITELIPNFFVNEQRTNIEEFQVGSGKLLIHGFDLERISEPEEVAFRNALIRYVHSSDFKPNDSVDIETIQHYFPVNIDEETERKDLAYRCRAWADNEKSQKMSAVKANDGNPFTFWTTAAQTDSHWWCIDLGSVQTLSELVIEVLNYEVVDFTILSSLDGQEWTPVRDVTSKQVVYNLTEKIQARMLKLVFRHPLNVAPGIRKFQAFK